MMYCCNKLDVIVPILFGEDDALKIISVTLEKNKVTSKVQKE